MPEPSVTIDQVMEWNPCKPLYTRRRIEELFAGREWLTATDIAALDIPTQDRLWALLHNEFLTDEQMHLLACNFAEAVVHLFGDDPRPAAAIAAKRAWLRGEIGDEELAAARDAAGAAARDAADAAARDAAWDAAWAAARDAAGDAQLQMILAATSTTTLGPTGATAGR